MTSSAASSLWRPALRLLSFHAECKVSWKFPGDLLTDLHRHNGYNRKNVATDTGRRTLEVLAMRCFGLFRAARTSR